MSRVKVLFLTSEKPQVEMKKGKTKGFILQKHFLGKLSRLEILIWSLKRPQVKR